MKISILGKGGSGKTTISTMLTKYLAKNYTCVLAIDADLNSHLCEYLDISRPNKNLSEHFDALANYVLGETNIVKYPKIGTIPLINNSKYFNFESVILNDFISRKDNIIYMSSGTYKEEDIGNGCFHGKLNTLELLIHRLHEEVGQLVLIDSAAGIDIVATSLYFATDLYFFVIEPTEKSIEVFQDYLKVIKDKIEKYDIKIVPIFNKIHSMNDVEFIISKIGQQENYFIIKESENLHKFEQGEKDYFEIFINENMQELEKIVEFTKNFKVSRDYLAPAIEETFVSECNKWVNDAYQEDFIKKFLKK